eukprot:3910475-Alexandrium_andersonii.AAC.1
MVNTTVAMTENATVVAMAMVECDRERGGDEKHDEHYDGGNGDDDGTGVSDDGVGVVMVVIISMNV